MTIEGKRFFALSALCIQTSAVILLMRYSRGVLKEDYLSSTLLILVELVKFILSLVFALVDGKFNTRRIVLVFQSSVVMLPVALIYYIQNFLVLYSLKHLEAPVYHVLSQLKILTSAMFFVLLMKRSLHESQWRALILLVIGIVLVKYECPKCSSAYDIPQQNTNISGIVAALAAACTSGLAGVLLEFAMKKRDSNLKLSVWEKNVQLSWFSIVFGCLNLLPDVGLVSRNGFFHGYSYVTFGLVFGQAIGGLLVGFAVKFSNTVMKGFSSAIAIIFTSVLSVMLFEQELTLVHWLGILSVVLSLFQYTDFSSSISKTRSRKNSMDPQPTQENTSHVVRITKSKFDVKKKKTLHARSKSTNFQ